MNPNERNPSGIHQAHTNASQSAVEIPLDDRDTWQLFGAGPNEEREGIGYPFSSHEAMTALERFRPTTIDELAAFLALYRPGPVKDGLFDEFIRRKETGDWDKTGDDVTDRLLGPTFGMVLYSDDEEGTQPLPGKTTHLFKTRKKVNVAALLCYQRAYASRQQSKRLTRPM